MLFKFPFSSKQQPPKSRIPLALESNRGDNLCVYLKHRSICNKKELPIYSSAPHPLLSAITASYLPYTFTENPIHSTNYDKVFASCWINDHQVAVGTKCNKLLLVSTHNSRVIEIPFLSIQSQGALLDRPSLIPQACVGIHSIAMNPSKTKIAVGSGKPYEVIVYALPSLEPIAALSGHSDLVFGIDFITDDVLTTASRDSTVGIFSLTSTPSSYLSFGLTSPLPIHNPIALCHAHKNKVRDLKFNKKMQQLITLGGDARVKIWDATFMQVTSDVPLKYADETVCMGIDIQRQLVSIGSQEYISLFDLRSNQFVHHFESADDGWGVRSLAHNAHILASGGGMGRLAFYDLRAMAYLPIGEKNQGFLEIQSEGYLNRDPTYMSHFHGTVVKHAIYTLSYCEDHCRLFTGGGPLQLGLCGSYMAEFNTWLTYQRSSFSFRTYPAFLMMPFNNYTFV